MKGYNLTTTKIMFQGEKHCTFNFSEIFKMVESRIFYGYLAEKESKENLTF